MRKAIEGVDYFVYLVPFPDGVHGAAVTNPDGTFSVYINEKDTRERQRKAGEPDFRSACRSRLRPDRERRS